MRVSNSAGLKVVRNGRCRQSRPPPNPRPAQPGLRHYKSNKGGGNGKDKLAMVAKLEEYKRLGFDGGEGDVYWPEACMALAEINFTGWATCEGSDNSLENTSQLMDELAGPVVTLALLHH